MLEYGDHAIEHEEQNLELLTGEGLVEERNKAFYNRFQFPPPPLQLHFLTDPSFERRFLNQDLGDWTHRRVPERPRILVAGCGTFQAITVALQFPTASVVGIDLSAESLATCRKAAREIGLRTLSVQEQSLTEASYAEEFDYIVCTGVIHHLDDPEAGLRALARALKPQGVLDLMVYNRFHRIPTSAYQRAIRLLLAGVPTGDLDHGIAFTRTLLDEYPMQGHFGQYVKNMGSEALLADTFLQPIEHSYTVESLASMVDRCGLEILSPHLSLWGKTWSSYQWNVTFATPELRTRYAGLSDLDRWKITNWLLQERSPLLWFYLQKDGSGFARKSERQVDEEFLETRFRRARATRRHFRRERDGNYVLSPASTEYPTDPVGPEKERIIAAADGKTPLREILRQLEFEPEAGLVHRLRLELTTSAFPYLTAVSHMPGRAWTTGNTQRSSR